MPRDGNGNYSVTNLINGGFLNDYNAGNTNMEPERFDFNNDDIAAALTGSLASDGQTQWSGDLKAGGNIINNLGDGALAGDSVNLQQTCEIASNGDYYIDAGTGGGAAYTLSALAGNFVPSAYFTVQSIRFLPLVANTSTSPTATIPGLGAKIIGKFDSSGNVTSLSLGDLSLGRIANLQYAPIADRLVLLNPPAATLVSPYARLISTAGKDSFPGESSGSWLTFDAADGIFPELIRLSIIYDPQGMVSTPESSADGRFDLIAGTYNVTAIIYLNLAGGSPGNYGGFLLRLYNLTDANYVTSYCSPGQYTIDSYGRSLQPVMANINTSNFTIASTKTFILQVQPSSNGAISLGLQNFFIDSGSIRYAIKIDITKF